MQSYSTIIGVIELRLSGIGYRTTKARYGIGNSTVTLIMTLDFLKTLEAVKANFKKLDMMIRILSDPIVTGNSISQNFLMKYAG